MLHCLTFPVKLYTVLNRQGLHFTAHDCLRQLQNSGNSWNSQQKITKSHLFHFDLPICFFIHKMETHSLPIFCSTAFLKSFSFVCSKHKEKSISCLENTDNFNKLLPNEHHVTSCIPAENGKIAALTKPATANLPITHLLHCLLVTPYLYVYHLPYMS